MTVHKDIEARIIQAIQASSDPAALEADLDQFLPNATITVSDRVETARISRRGTQVRIEFGRAFLERELGAPEDLLFVLLHECFHHVLGHLSRPRGRHRPDPVRREAENIAADILVNRAVCELFFPRGVGLLRRLYDERDPVGVLLRPPEDGDREPAWRRFWARLRTEGFDDRVVRKAWWIRVQGWFGNIPFEFLTHEVVGLLKRLGCRAPLVFLGDHSRRNRVTGLPWDVEGADATRGDAIEEDLVPDDVEPIHDQRVARAVRAALDHDPSNPRRAVVHTPITSPCYGPGRRDYPFLAMGFWPALFHGPRLDRALDEQRARVYVDVSGSFESQQARVFGFLLALADEVGPTVFQFSNRVEEISIREIAEGVRRTTGGTDFDCVLRHALERRFRRIVVITDGIGDLDEANAEAFRVSGASLYLVLIERAEHFADLCPLRDLARQVWELD